MTRNTLALNDKVLRTGDRYDLVLFDNLSPAEQAAIQDLAADPDFYGVLRPRAGSPGTIRAVNRDTALLLLTLRTPGPLPSFARRSAPDRQADQVAELLLDGILEIRQGDDFVCGADAVRLLGPDREGGDPSSLAVLSKQALQYAAELGLDDAQRLSIRLYLYNRIPLTPRWEQLLPDGQSVLDYLSDLAGDAIRKLDRHYSPTRQQSLPRAWLTWSRRKEGQARLHENNYKLYVSPNMDSLPATFSALVDVLEAHRVRNFKIGADAPGLLRPDKLVAYFNDFDSLASAARDLEERTAGTIPHGVPFTAPITADGLLSWGMDPPYGAASTRLMESGSWRVWVTNRLASALISARSEKGSSVPAWKFALERLRLEGVDVEHWTPSASIWVDHRG